MDRVKPSSVKPRETKKKTESQALGIKKKTLKAGKDSSANGGENIKLKLEAMKKFSQGMTNARGETASVSPSKLPSSSSDKSKNKYAEEALREAIKKRMPADKSKNKYTEEALREAIKKRINDKFQLNKVPLTKTNSNEEGSVETKKKLGSPEFSEAQLEGLVEKFSQKIYISLEERSVLARELSLTEYQVQTWFSNRRTKMKKTQDLLFDPRALHKPKPQATKKTEGSLIKTREIKSSEIPIPKMKPFQVDALSRMSEIQEKMRNPEIIEILDDEDDSTLLSVETSEPFFDRRKTVSKEGKIKNVLAEITTDCVSVSKEKLFEGQKDKEIEILKKEIQIILNDMVKKSVMEIEVDAWKVKYESVTKAYKEKEQVVKNLEVKIPNMIEEFTKCVENKEYLFDLKEKEMKKNETVLVEKENQIKIYQEEKVKLNNDLDLWKSEKSDFVMKVASLDVKASKLSNELLKKDMELKEIKKKEKENVFQMKKLSSDMELSKSESMAQNQNKEEFTKLKAKVEIQANSLASVTKSCEYQKSQISYLRREVETKVELISMKENELKQVKESFAHLSAIQTTVNQLMVKCENQNKIIENQKTIITKYKVQTEEQAKQISKLAELQKTLKENNGVQTSLQHSLEKKSSQIKNLKKNIEGKNDEMKKFKQAQDQLFSQINDLELKNFNKTQDLQSIEAQCENLKAIDKKSLKTVTIYEATSQFMQILKENQKKQMVNKVKKDVPVITLDEQIVFEAELSKIDNKETHGSTPESQTTNYCETKVVESIPLRFNFGEEAVPYISEQDLSKEKNLAANEKEMHVHKNSDENSEIQKKVSDKISSKQTVHMLTYLWPMVGTEIFTPQKKLIKSLLTVSKIPTLVAKQKPTRKLVERQNIAKSAVLMRTRSGLKRKLLKLDSGIPTKRMRKVSVAFKYENQFMLTKFLSLPQLIKLNTWESLRSIKLKLSSSIMSLPSIPVQPAPIHQALPVCYNWPIVPYSYLNLSTTRHVAILPRYWLPLANTDVPNCQKHISWPIVPYSKPAKLGWLNPDKICFDNQPLAVDRFDLLFPPNSLVAASLPGCKVNMLEKCQAGQKRKSYSFACGSSKRLRLDSPAWPLVVYRTATVKKLEASVPTISSFDLLYPRECLLTIQTQLLGKKRVRTVDNTEDSPRHKKLKLSPKSLDISSTPWTVAIFYPTRTLSAGDPKPQVSSVFLNFPVTLTDDLLSYLPTLQINWPLIQHPRFKLVHRYFSLRESLQVFSVQIQENPQVASVQLHFSAKPLPSHVPELSLCWPIVPYTPLGKATVKRKLSTSHSVKPAAAAKKAKLCGMAAINFFSSRDMCRQLLVSLIKVLPTGSSSLQTQTKVKRFRVSIQNRPKLTH